ncbi:class I adenylate-forming enzyme family protein [Pseudonocardia xishanensis]|uniref:Long-chain fatty acid--CoA ligase n=1 Tax=Pseudonocardia xishanensis TaxID=630995 RepID=A0ABP8RRX9_9PSEU
MLVSDLARRNAEYYADRDAVVVPGVRTETWASLHARTERWASAMARLGLGAGDRVAMLSENCAEFVEFFFGCARSGVAGAPLNLRHSAHEQIEYVNYVEPVALLVHAHQAEAAAQWLEKTPSVRHVVGFGGPHSFELDLETILAAEEGTPPAPLPRSDAPYMLCPTSGTTGRLKAAVLTQDNAMSAIFAWAAEYPVLEWDTNLQCIPQYLNAGGPAHVSPVFLKGGRTVVLPGFDPDSFVRAVADYRVTHTVAVPTMVNAVLAHPRIGDLDTSSLRAIVLGGAPVTRELVLAARASLGDCLYPTLGMAETFSCGLVLSPQNQHPDGTPDQVRQLGSLGRPHCHLDARLVDAEGVDVPRDGTTPGELWFRGGSVSAGYYAMPEETAASRAGDWLRTGDVAVVDADGFVTVVDRLKDIIITGGLNVATGEVEAALASHPGVAESAVIGRADERWGEAVHAVVVRAAGSTVTESELLEHVADRLARYKQPRSFAFVEALPRNSTGKVLKRVLRAELAESEPASA